jgi:hypothetical protein
MIEGTWQYRLELTPTTLAEKALNRRRALAARPERCLECDADQNDHPSGKLGHTFQFRNEKEVAFD